METLNIGVVGGGFSGLYSVFRLSSNHNLTLFEEHDKVGYPKHCTGLVSKWTLNKLGEPGKASLVSAYKKASFVVQNVKYSFQGDPIAVKLDRVRLEQELLRKSIEYGTRFLSNCKVYKIDPDVNSVESKCGKYKFDALIIADGLNGKLSSSLGLRKKYRKIYGINIELRTNRKAVQYIDEFSVVFHPVFKGFFGWLVPITENNYLIGGGSIEPLKYNTILEGLNIQGEIIEKYGGIILTGPPERHPYKNTVYVLGDAAGLTKPFTGGGLYPNVKIIDCFTSSKLDGWRDCVDNVVEELARQVYISRIFHSDLNVDALSYVLSLLNNSQIGRSLSLGIDYDDHTSILRIMRENKIQFLKLGMKFMIRYPVSSVKMVSRLIFASF